MSSVASSPKISSKENVEFTDCQKHKHGSVYLHRMMLHAVRSRGALRS